MRRYTKKKVSTRWPSSVKTHPETQAAPDPSVSPLHTRVVNDSKAKGRAPFYSSDLGWSFASELLCKVE